MLNIIVIERANCINYIRNNNEIKFDALRIRSSQ